MSYLHYGSGSYGSSALGYGTRSSGLGYSSSFSSPHTSYSSGRGSYSSGTPLNISLSGSSGKHRGSVSAGYGSGGYSSYGSSGSYCTPYSPSLSSFRSSLSRSTSLPRDYRRDRSLNSRYSSYSSRTTSPARSSVYTHTITCRAILPDSSTRTSRYDDRRFPKDSQRSGAKDAIPSAPNSSKDKGRHPPSTVHDSSSTSDYESSSEASSAEEVVVASSLSNKGISSQEYRRPPKHAVADRDRSGPNLKASSEKTKVKKSSSEKTRADKSTSVRKSSKEKKNKTSSEDVSAAAILEAVAPIKGKKLGEEKTRKSRKKSAEGKTKRSKSTESLSRSSSGYISRSDSVSDRESAVSSKSTAAGNSKSGARTSGSHNGDIDYKKLYEEQLAENDKLMERLREHEKDLRNAKETIDNNSKVTTARSALAESERREKRALERKLSEMEEELRQMQKLKAENEKLRAENRALTRVVSKLTSSAAGSMSGHLSSLTRPK